MRRAAITINRPRDEVEQRWRAEAARQRVDEAGGVVRFVDAPGDRGTEIHVELRQAPPGGSLGEAVQKLRGREPLARVRDELRHFKQLVETGEIPRSDAQPDGERVERKP